MTVVVGVSNGWLFDEQLPFELTGWSVSFAIRNVAVSEGVGIDVEGDPPGRGLVDGDLPRVSPGAIFGSSVRDEFQAEIASSRG
jgi:hypothetical protein